jgi:hypothetical protein
VIDLTDSVTRSFNLTSSAGAAVDADSTPTYAIELPTGVAGTPPAVQHGDLGEYYVVYPTTMAGLHREVLTAVVGGVTVVIRRVFTVEEPSALFVDTDEALEYLNAQGLIVEPAKLEWLRTLCAVACDAVERDLGKWIAPRSVTEVFDGGRSALVLTRTPVISVTTVVDSGTTLTGSDYVLDTRVGIVYRGTATSPTCFLVGRGSASITYRVGYMVPPRIARDVALRGVQRMWQQTMQMPHPALDDLGADGMLFQPTGVLTPIEMEAYMRLKSGPVIA